MDLNTPENRMGVMRLAQFIRPELKDRVITLAKKCSDLKALREHPQYQEYARLSTMKNGLYPDLPKKYD